MVDLVAGRGNRLRDRLTRMPREGVALGVWSRAEQVDLGVGHDGGISLDSVRRGPALIVGIRLRIGVPHVNLKLCIGVLSRVN